MTSASGMTSGMTSGRSSRAGVNGDEGEHGKDEKTGPPNMVQLLPKGTLAKKEEEKKKGKERARGDEKERDKERSQTRSGERGGDEQEMEERKRRAMARNKSWADDYHYRGW